MERCTLLTMGVQRVSVSPLCRFMWVFFLKKGIFVKKARQNVKLGLELCPISPSSQLRSFLVGVLTKVKKKPWWCTNVVKVCVTLFSLWSYNVNRPITIDGNGRLKATESESLFLFRWTGQTFSSRIWMKLCNGTNGALDFAYIRDCISERAWCILEISSISA